MDPKSDAKLFAEFNKKIPVMANARDNKTNNVTLEDTERSYPLYVMNPTTVESITEIAVKISIKAREDLFDRHTVHKSISLRIV